MIKSMCLLKHKFVFILIFITAVSSSSAQWQQLQAIEGGPVYDMAKKGNDIFIGTNGGVYFSPDSGNTWVPRNNGIPGEAIKVKCILFVDSNLYAGTEMGGVFLSSDYGNSWTPVNNGLTSMNVNALASNGNKLYAALSPQNSNQGGFFVSDNNGASWYLGNPSFANYIAEVFADSTVLCVGEYNCVIKTSYDNGLTWNSHSFTSSTSGIMQISKYGNILMVSAGRYIYKSLDNGLTWSNLYYNVYGSISGLAVHDSFMIFSAYHPAGTFYRFSHDLGVTWSASISSPLVNTYHMYDSVLFACSIDAFKISEDSSTTWQIRNSGLFINNISKIHASGERILASTLSGLALSVDSGFTYTEVSSAMNTYNVGCIYKYDSARYFAGTLDFSNPVYMSTDSGNTWQSWGNGVLSSTGVFSMELSDTVLIAGTSDSIFVNNDLSNNWLPANIGFTSSDVWTMKNYGTSTYCGTYTGIFATHNSGASWIQQANNNFGNPDYVLALEIHDSVMYASTRQALYSSIDFGDNWTLKSSTLPNFGWVKDIVIRDSILFLNIRNQGVHYSIDGGVTLVPMNEGLMDFRVHKLTADSFYLYASTEGSSIYRRSFDNIISGLPVSEANFQFTIFPNPAKSEVSVQLSKQCKYGMISIYDLSGQLIKNDKILNSKFTTLDIENLNPGIYFIKIMDENYSAVKKLIKL